MLLFSAFLSTKRAGLRKLPYGGLDHLSLWIEAITLYGPFTIAFDIKNPRFLDLYKKRRGVVSFGGAIAPISVHFC
jgi:hypothetical protein